MNKEITYTKNMIRYYSELFGPWSKKVIPLKWQLFKLKLHRHRRKKRKKVI